MEIAIMVEGQDGVNWERWQHIVRLAEELGFAGLYRSDHFTNASPPDKDALELWVSLTWLAANTKRIEFGPMVTPFSFRDPVFTARMGKDVDDLSNGRLILGIGAGWQQREHQMFNYPLLSVSERLDRFEEGTELVHRLLRDDARVNFEGAYYTVRDAALLPRPQRAGGPRILIGGNGEKRTMPLAAKYADEWNGVFLDADRFAAKSRKLDELLAAEGRAPETMRRSLMTGLVFGKDDAAYQRRLQLGLYGGNLERDGLVHGTPSAISEQLARHAEAGVQRILLQWLDLDAIDDLADLARAVL